MKTPIDLSDVDVVSKFELSLPMKLLVDAERALCLVNGASDEDRRVVETAFWNAYKGPTGRGVSILIRFWCLMDAFGGRRFKALFMRTGFQIIEPSVATAAGMRLNAHWGFNPQRLLTGIQDALNDTPRAGPSATRATLGVVPEIPVVEHVPQVAA